MTTHTPGPWLITPNGTVYALDETGSCNRFSVQVQGGFERSRRGADLPTMPAELDANARLIAAAPDLLAACEAFVRYDSDTDDDVHMMLNYAEALRLTKAAIARATGAA
jgi:hypothetical protein